MTPKGCCSPRAWTCPSGSSGPSATWRGLCFATSRYPPRSMSDDTEAAVAQRPAALHLRVRAGLRRPHNWVQLVKFCLVGGSGYVVNLVVFAIVVKALGLHHLIGATAAFVV